MGFIKYMLGLQSKGSFGEDAAKMLINNPLIKGYKKYLRNLYVPMRGDKFTEIDIVMLHENKIYVFEIKTYTGWIFASEESTNWTVCYKNREKHKLYNPIKQNQTHINALSKFLNIDKDKFFSYIIFLDECVFKKAPPMSGDNYKIVKGWKATTDLMSSINNNKPIFTTSEIDDIYFKLEPLTNRDENIRKQHAERINKQYKKAGV